VIDVGCTREMDAVMGSSKPDDDRFAWSSRMHSQMVTLLPPNFVSLLECKPIETSDRHLDTLSHVFNSVVMCHIAHYWIPCFTSIFVCAHAHGTSPRKHLRHRSRGSSH